MPQNEDPYATPRAKLFDLLLCLLTIAFIALVILTAPRHHRASPRADNVAPTHQIATR